MLFIIGMSDWFEKTLTGSYVQENDFIFSSTMWNALPNVECPVFLFYEKEKVYHRMSFRSDTYKYLCQG
ncbi:hypothetical protein RND71_023210 [Anisodus tanguticus]|uniref:Uncharacterized protein n=1 Tax=Anisodus tanguticus TaxID=243964 RepID=A0AAE1RTZ7_9SOLA|nr:hypothetical protein RND71_023210 [Anisodus tanguticus]